MKHTRVLTMLLIAGLACSGEGIEPGYPFVPKPTEPLALTVETRLPVSGERLPEVDVSAVAGGVQVRVARPPRFGCLLAEAAVGRGPGVLAVFAEVSGHPSAICAGERVWEYSGAITDVEPGRYTVDIYEAWADLPFKRIATRTVTVP